VYVNVDLSKKLEFPVKIENLTQN